MKWSIILLLAAALLAGCGGTVTDQQQQEFIDKCTVEQGPYANSGQVFNYCLAKYRMSQREK